MMDSGHNSRKRARPDYLLGPDISDGLDPMSVQEQRGLIAYFNGRSLYVFSYLNVVYSKNLVLLSNKVLYPTLEKT